MTEQNKFRSWLWLVVAMLLLAVLVGSIVKFAPARTVKLPDGREITLAAVTYGTQHRFVYGKPLIKALAPFVSQRWAARQGLRVAEHKTATPTIMFWVLWRDTGAPPQRKGTANQPASRAAVFDEQGNQTEPMWLSTSLYPPTPEILFGWCFSNYPRRAKTVGIKILQYNPAEEFLATGDQQTIAEFKVANPGPRHHPQWTAAPLPASQHDGELNFVFLNLVADKPTPRPWRWDQFSPHHANWNTALFQVVRNGKPCLDWQVASLRATDPTGNVAEQTTARSYSVGDYRLFDFDGILWPSEPVWRLRVEFSRSDNFAPDELCRLPAVSLPVSLASPERTNVQLSVQGVTIQGVEVILATSFGLFWPGAFRHTADLKVHSAGLAEGTRISIDKATDDQGRAVLNQRGLSGTNTITVFELCVPPGATNLDFTLAVHKSRFAEYRVKPLRNSSQAPRALLP